MQNKESRLSDLAFYVAVDLYNIRLQICLVTSKSGAPMYYDNTGLGVFSDGIQNQKVFWLKINCSQMKLLTKSQNT